MYPPQYGSVGPLANKKNQKKNKKSKNGHIFKNNTPNSKITPFNGMKFYGASNGATLDLQNCKNKRVLCFFGEKKNGTCVRIQVEVF